MTTKTIQGIICLLLLFLLSSCESDNASQDQPDNIPTSIAQKEGYGADLLNSSARWKYSKDIVERLFDEAMEKDKELKSINDRINQQSISQVDSLADYHFFAGNNDNYWSSANKYASSISDTLLRDQVRDLFKNLEGNYRKKVMPFEQKKTQIQEKSKILSDQLVVLKLMTTVTMITQYQENGIPKVDQLEHLINDYDLLIKESQVGIDKIR